MKKTILGVFYVVCIFFTACSFDYGQSNIDESRPDIIMRDVEYTRVRNGEAFVRFDSEYVERFENQRIMNLRNFTFEEFQNNEGNNTTGSAGEASIELDSGNIHLSGGVKIIVDSEDITIETGSLHWQDKQKQLTGGLDEITEIRRSDGSGMSGRGFAADARERTWSFASGAEGVFIDDDKVDGFAVSAANDEAEL